MEKFCNICKGENTYIISETSSSYSYCKNCGHNKKTALKQCLFDSILKSIDTYLKNIKIKSKYNLKIEVKFENEVLKLKIDDIVLDKKNCPFTLSKKDEYFFKNNIIYLIEDELSISGEVVQLNVDFAAR
ncbi:MAG: hypothetical protein ACI4PU_10660 [Intestinibacter sp.]